MPADSLSWSSSLSFDGTRGRERNGSRYLYLPVKNTIIEFCYYDKVQTLRGTSVQVRAFQTLFSIQSILMLAVICVANRSVH